MNKIAFVFPGQGSQSVGMGRDLYDSFSEVKELYKEASKVLGYDVSELSFDGPIDELNKTFRTQPCLLVASIAAYTALKLNGIKPYVVAGHSLGEYSALVSAGSLSFKDAVKITEIRGRIMQEAVPEGEGLMAAILGLDRKIIDDICKGIESGYVSTANYNCPGQVVIAGHKKAVQDAINKAKDAGAKKTVILSVSVPSHCRLMKDASKELQKVLNDISIKAPETLFISNAYAKFISNPEEIRNALVTQISQPVLWEDCIAKIISSGVITFIEVGPGKVLSGLIKRIEPSANTLNVEDISSLNRTLSEIDYAN